MNSTKMSTDLTNAALTFDLASVIDKWYIGVGTTAMISNLLIAIILLSDRKSLLPKSALITGVTISHFLNGCYSCASGAFRTQYRYLLGEYTEAWSCVGLIYTNIYNFEFQSIGFLMCVIGFERLTAICWPVWYRRRWTSKLSWNLTALAYLGACFGMFGGLAAAKSMPNNSTSWRCDQQAVFGKTYNSYSAAITSIGGLLAVVTTSTALICGHRRFAKLHWSSDDGAKMRRQLQITRAMLTVATLDLTLTVIPNGLVLLRKVAPDLLPTNTPYYCNIAYSVNSTINILAYLMFNSNFRKSAKRLFMCRNQLWERNQNAVSSIALSSRDHRRTMMMSNQRLERSTARTVL